MKSLEERKLDCIEKLRDPEQYYGELGNKFLSYSRLEMLIENPKLFNPNESQPPTKAMVMGDYLHRKVLEPHTLNDIVIADCSNRNTKAYKLLAEEHGGALLLKHEQETLDNLSSDLLKCKAARDLLKHPNAKYEEPNIMEISDTWWRGKADVVIPGEMIIDLKTTSDISRFRWSASKYNYDAQAWLYSTMWGLPFTFVVVDKKTSAIGIFECSDKFLRDGYYKVQEAVSNYKLIFKNEEFNNDNYYIRDVL